MFCKNCGKQVEDGVKFCPNCGSAMSVPEEVGKSASEHTAKAGEEKKGYEQVLTKENAEKALQQAKELKKRYNIGHLGVLVASVLALVAAFMPNSGAWKYSTIVSLLSEGNRGDGTVYALILAAILVVAVITTYFKKNLLTVVFAAAGTVWIFYMFKTCEQSVLNGVGLLLFPVAGILLIVSAIAAFSMGRRAK